MLVVRKVDTVDTHTHTETIGIKEFHYMMVNNISASTVFVSEIELN